MRDHTRVNQQCKESKCNQHIKGANQFSDPVQNKINYFFPDSVVTTSVVIGSIFFASDQLFRVKQLSVGTSANLILNMKFQLASNHIYRIQLFVTKIWKFVLKISNWMHISNNSILCLFSLFYFSRQQVCISMILS